MKQRIFRQVALERLSSPEQLDQLMQVTSPRGWLALLALVALIATAAAWSLVATVPTEAAGQGILLRGGRVLSVVSSEAGQIEELLVQAGDSVAAGQVVARVRPVAPGERAAPPAELRSPYTGRIAELAVAPGSVVAAGSSIATLEDTTRPMEAVVYLPRDSARNVRTDMDARVVPLDARRDTRGFIRGTVRSVAPFPATFQSMMLVLANPQLAQEFLAGGSLIEVRIALLPDPAAPAPIENGTLCQVHVIVDERRPIDLVLPAR
jgi:multidrug efflux pump subunit AcrA (membrane-fusion protein)